MTSADRRKWDARYRERGAATRVPDAFLLALDAVLPRTGRALDVGGGSGRHGLWLARRGLAVTIADVSPVGLEIARTHAREVGASIRTEVVDLVTEPLPAGPWDVIAVFHFLHRPLFPALATHLAPDGWLVVDHPTRTNLHRHPHPSERFLLEDGELPSLVTGLQISSYHEGWMDNGRHEAHLVARRR